MLSFEKISPQQKPLWVEVGGDDKQRHLISRLFQSLEISGKSPKLGTLSSIETLKWFMAELSLLPKPKV